MALYRGWWGGGAGGGLSKICIAPLTPLKKNILFFILNNMYTLFSQLPYESVKPPPLAPGEKKKILEPSLIVYQPWTIPRHCVERFAVLHLTWKCFTCNMIMIILMILYYVSHQRFPPARVWHCHSAPPSAATHQLPNRWEASSWTAF